MLKTLLVLSSIQGDLALVPEQLYYVPDMVVGKACWTREVVIQVANFPYDYPISQFRKI